MSNQVMNFNTDAPALATVLPEAAPLPFLPEAQARDHLGEFLGRPILIDTETWTSGASINKHIDPWAVFLNQPAVERKLENFKYLRGDLKVQVQINGTPFHFGRILMSYEPRNGLRGSTTKTISTDGDFRMHSCLPHGELDPSTSRPIDLTCPFISPKMWIDLTSVTGAQLGILNYDTIVALASSSATVDPVTINTYAWLENVQLSFPTRASKATFTEQGKRRSTAPVNKGSDEYEADEPNKGVISGPLKTLSSIAGYLGEAPVIGPYAAATSVFLKGSAGLASLFGFSKPRNLKAEAVMIQSTVGNMVNTDMADSSVTLTVGGKSELTIDPRVVGLDNDLDELAIPSIACKWTICPTVYTWNVTDVPDTIIAAFPVSPYMGSQTTAEPYELTAATFAALPFDMWRGSMEVEVNIVCSRYHRGRLRFEWDPDDVAGNDLNTAFNEVVDIQNGKSFCLRFDYVRPEGFAKLVFPSDTRPNGFFRIKVQNELVATDSVTPVKLFMRFRGGPDLTFAKPNGRNYRRLSSYTETAAKIEQGTLAEYECDDVTMYSAPTNERFDQVFMGDPIRSFRSLIKRYEFAYNMGFLLSTSSLQGERMYFQGTQFPQPPGYHSAGGIINSGVGTYNPGLFTLAGYLEQAFLYKRGSFRHLIDLRAVCNTTTAQTSAFIGNVSVTRTSGDAAYTTAGTPGAEYPVDDAEIADAVNTNRSGVPVQSSLAGTQIFPSSANMREIQVEVPFYNNHRYVTNFWQKADDDTSVGLSEGWQVEVPCNNFSAIGANFVANCDVFTSAGEDFTMGFFLGPPLFWDIGPTPALDSAYAVGPSGENGY